MIQIKDLNIKFENHSVFESLSFDIADGNTCVIFIGKRGGKTALASAICGASDFIGGEVLIDGEAISPDNIELKRRIGFYSADMRPLGFMSVYELLKLFCDARGVDDEKAELQINEVLQLTELEALSDSSVSALSVYQRAKLGIATTLMGKPSLLVYDDIFKGLDKEESDDIAQILKMISSKKRTLLICSTPESAAKFCDYAIFINNGKPSLSGRIEDIEREINKTKEMNLSIRGNFEKIEKTLSALDEIVKVSLENDDGEIVSVNIEYKSDDKIKDKLFAAMAQINSPILSYKDISVSIREVYYSLMTDKSSSNKKEAAR